MSDPRSRPQFLAFPEAKERYVPIVNPTRHFANVFVFLFYTRIAFRNLMATVTSTPSQRKLFVYTARTQEGNALQGNIRAGSEEEVRDYLISKSVIPLEVAEQSGLQRNISLTGKRIKQKEIGAFFRQLSTMINAGIPLVRSLNTLREQTQNSNPTFANVISRVISDLENGNRLPDALTRHPKTFSPLVIAMVRAGDASGNLDAILAQVADNIEASVKLRGQIRSAMTYPIAILILATLIVAFMLIVIVPVFAQLFASLGGTLPLPTQILIGASNVIKWAGPLLIVAAVAGVFWWRNNKHKDSVRNVVDPLMLRMPIFGNLVNKLVIARFARNSGSLLNAGMPIMDVLDIVGPTSGSIVVEHAISDVRDRVRVGEQLAPQLAEFQVFPAMLVDMVAVGEDAGEIPTMMTRVAKAYDEEVESLTDSLSSLIEPVMLVLLGVVVGSIVISLYLPIFTIYDQINKS